MSNLTDFNQWKLRPDCWGVTKWSIWSTDHIIRSNQYDQHAYRCIPKGDDTYRCISKGDNVYRCLPMSTDAD